MFMGEQRLTVEGTGHWEVGHLRAEILCGPSAAPVLSQGRRCWAEGAS